MLPQIYEAMRRAEKVNWWFVGRRRLIRDWFIRDRQFKAATGKGKRLRILDLGCGTGAMVEDFLPYGQAIGTDLSAVALGHCRERGLRNISYADATQLPFRDNFFHCISAMDVIEHIRDDAAALRECHRVCAPGGVMLVTVPALRWLWTTRDVRLEHLRRYRRPELMSVARQAGFEVEKCSFYTLCMFPAFCAVVLYRRLRGGIPDVKQDVPMPPAWLNRTLLSLLLAEQWLMRWVSYPVGVSLFCVLRKR